MTTETSETHDQTHRFNRLRPSNGTTRTTGIVLLAWIGAILFSFLAALTNGNPDPENLTLAGWLIDEAESAVSTHQGNAMFVSPILFWAILPASSWALVRDVLYATVGVLVPLSIINAGADTLRDAVIYRLYYGDAPPLTPSLLLEELVDGGIEGISYAVAALWLIFPFVIALWILPWDVLLIAISNEIGRC